MIPTLDSEPQALHGAKDNQGVESDVELKPTHELRLDWNSNVSYH